MIINYKNYDNNPNYPDKKKQQLNKYSKNESDDKLLLIQKDYTNFK